LIAGMSAGEHAAMGTIDWYVEPDYTRLDVRTRKSLRVRHDEQRANSLGLIITTSLLFVLFAGAITFGGHAAISPLLREAVVAHDARGAMRTGSILYTMPDGVYCRHMSFDNATGEIVEGAIEHCPDAVDEESAPVFSAFKWDTR
jgi:hypothetical protein